MKQKITKKKIIKILTPILYTAFTITASVSAIMLGQIFVKLIYTHNIW